MMQPSPRISCKSPAGPPIPEPLAVLRKTLRSLQLIDSVTQEPAPRWTLGDLPKLKQAMADAHPDRGGNAKAFIKARATYVEARRALRETKRRDGGRM
jgi:hypothetical protein